ncbi:hypothetical protein TIFTF001_002985 [Ficus carica]|uniref:Uncharacterized protein n=1 Tax=Ficus carica TaxID=3494 RepID=A0AA87Z5Y5_FICCA|nr:hypothetical protein TIFTF001_002985 [Ficus carica]
MLVSEVGAERLERVGALYLLAMLGDVELTNMQLKPEALNALKLPVKVKAGFLGSVKLKCKPFMLLSYAG